MHVLFARKISAITICLLLTSLAQAATYSVQFTAGPTFDAPLGAGPDGTGSFDWNPTTKILTDFTWDFAGDTGGLSNSFLSSAYNGGTLGSLIFEWMTAEDVHPNDVFGGVFSTLNVVGVFPGPGNVFNVYDKNHPLSPSTYAFTDSAGTTFFAAGEYSVSLVPIPAAAPLLASALGLLGYIGFRSGKRRACFG